MSIPVIWYMIDRWTSKWEHSEVVILAIVCKFAMLSLHSSCSHLSLMVSAFLFGFLFTGCLDTHWPPLASIPNPNSIPVRMRWLQWFASSRNGWSGPVHESLGRASRIKLGSFGIPIYWLWTTNLKTAFFICHTIHLLCTLFLLSESLPWKKHSYPASAHRTLSRDEWTVLNTC